MNPTFPRRPVLVAHVSAGNGHRAAAGAVREALDEQGVPSLVTDVLHFAIPLFRFVCSDLYAMMGRRARGSFEALYRATDHLQAESRVRRLLDAMSAKQALPFGRFVEENGFDTVVCTHFLPPVILAELRAAGRYRGRILVCVTDYGLHRMWVHPEVDTYFVASPELRDELASLGVPEERVVVSGIPTRLAFRGPSARGTAPRAQVSSRMKILFSASGLTDSIILEILQELTSAAAEVPLEVTLLAGRNVTLPDRVAAFRNGDRLRLECFGFRSDVDSLMKSADLLVTKPGGLTVSEAFCAGLPMLLVAPIPLQETLNARYVEACGAGRLCDEAAAVGEALREFAASPETLRRMGDAARAAARPHAAEVIARAVSASSGRLCAPETARFGRVAS